MAHETTLKLPLSIVSPVDLKRVKRELDNINDAMLQTEIREGEEAPAKPPKGSRPFEDLLETNKLDLSKEEERENLTKLLKHLIDHAPVAHMSFSAEPSAEFLSTLMTWMRENIDPYTLITIGLAPAIGAGCIVRTQNRYFDFSLKQALLDNKKNLMKEVLAVGKPAASAPVTAEVPVAQEAAQ